MVRQTDELIVAWSALSGASAAPGWRTISVAPAGSCALMAGRCFPRNEEALLAGFATTKLPLAEKLPDGLGFSVARVDLCNDGRTWLALTRKAPGSLDLFAHMVADVIGAMDGLSGQCDEKILRVLISRLRAWQEFMRRGQEPLSLEAEVGLVGELSVLAALAGAGLSVASAVEGWLGPLGGVQDFELGTGAIEVKSTLSSVGFTAKIGSLEQLDNSVRQPLFIAGVRFSRRDSGISLPELVASVRQIMKDDDEASRLVDDRLLAGGFQNRHADRYVRRFTLEEIRILEVTDDFPRLLPGTVPDGIREAVYEIDLDRERGKNFSVAEVLTKLGAL